MTALIESGCHSHTSSFLDALPPQDPDALLALIGLYRDDPRPAKLDLGVGVYKDAFGQTPVMRAIKIAEQRLLETQQTKSYLGTEGDAAFVDRLAVLPFGAEQARDPALTGVQTPGGSGALRLAAQLVAIGNRDATVWVGTPTWPNHGPIFAAAGLRVAEHPFFDQASQQLELDAMMTALAPARPGDILLLHGCCHNPSGAELDRKDWQRLREFISARGLTPIVDLAYQGLGQGLEEDAYSTRLLFDSVPAILVAYSCDKNFGLYRERTGALWVKASDETTAARARANMLALARTLWSMPPDHGAAAARIVLEDEDLASLWREELEAMRVRLIGLRAALAESHPRLAAIAGQTGMFSLLPISQIDVARLRADHGIYMASNGRINIAGLRTETIGVLASALAPYLRD